MKRWVFAFAAMTLLVAACSGTETSGVASLDNTGLASAGEDETDQADDRSVDEALADFGVCMRENGIENFEDPVLEGDGSFRFGGSGAGGGPGSASPPDDSEMAVIEICREHLEGVVSEIAGDGFDIADAEDRLVEFAACMRDHGIEMDDPDFTGAGGFMGLGGLDLSSDDTREAFEECQEAFAGFAGMKAKPLG